MSVPPESRLATEPGVHREYLHALGIEVWVSRDRLDVVEPVADESVADQSVADASVADASVADPASPGVLSDPDAAPPVDPVSNAPRPAGAAETVSFRVQGFRLGRALALIDEPLWPQRRFFLDVAHAMNGWRPDRREDVRFDWPQVHSGQLLSTDAGLDAAGRAFRAFVEAQAEDDARVLAAGPRVAELLGPEPTAAVLYLDGVVHGDDKRELWRRVLGLR